ncbi:hypothetical protein ACFV0T_41145 [Streptomyces sp. NPDC059582]|uniref:hypothetical protein n=1 Tax=Streptomyces sp. NPDC059582 TaxID=3346875 RepID=UPI0036BE5621
MVPVSHSARNVEMTAESLQVELARLQVQKQALERELAAVMAHLGSVERALGALEALMPGPEAAPSMSVSGAAAPQRSDIASTTARPADVSPAGPADVVRKSTLPAQQPQISRENVPSADDAGEQSNYGKLTQQILEFFAETGKADVRARDVAAALGRDSDSGSVNAVRSTLDRLVGTSRVQRTGRGLYRAKRS